jgi:hypothetical protein
MLQDDKDNKDRAEDDDNTNKVAGLKNTNAVSAFEVYSKRSHQHGNNSKLNKIKQKAVTSTTSNPVRLVQEAARKYGLTELSSELEKIRYSGNMALETRMESVFPFGRCIIWILYL